MLNVMAMDQQLPVKVHQVQAGGVGDAFCASTLLCKSVEVDMRGPLGWGQCRVARPSNALQTLSRTWGQGTPRRSSREAVLFEAGSARLPAQLCHACPSMAERLGVGGRAATQQPQRRGKLCMYCSCAAMRGCAAGSRLTSEKNGSEHALEVWQDFFLHNIPRNMLCAADVVTRRHLACESVVPFLHSSKSTNGPLSSTGNVSPGTEAGRLADLEAAAM